MASKRYLYSDTIDSFLQKNTDTIVGEITLSATQDINKETSNSWQQEVEVLKDVLAPYAQKGSVYFEYNIPRMGRRADVIVLIDGIVFVLEFKTSEQKFTREALIQVWDYAIDLKNFQEGSRDRILIPIVVAPKEKNKNCHIELKPFEDDVYQPLVSNNERLSECFDKTLSNIIPKHTFTKEDDDVWAKSGYDPTPTIIEAAVALYEHHTVEEITKHDGEIEVTAKCLDKIINECQSNKRKAICFITGVPGAGKTLIGLQTAIKQFEKENKAVYLSEKKKIENFPFSEPEYLISCMDRQPDWGLVVCLIGGGQEINKGEAGIAEWLKAMNEHFTDWDIYMSDKLVDKEYAEGNALDIINDQERLHIEPSLHLSMSMRSFRAEKVSLFVHQLLDLKKEEATQTLKDLNNYPIVLTRSLDVAKKWLKSHARGSERYGILASSKAERLKAISINVRYQPDFVHWFLEDENDIRSSNALEDTLTEFKVQGLEIDWACVAWDADLRLNDKHTQWKHCQLRSGTKWQNINKEINQQYQLNAYRVLLTRARQGMVIVVPNGDHGVPPDETRKPEWYDGIYNYLKEIGIKEIY